MTSHEEDLIIPPADSINERIIQLEEEIKNCQEYEHFEKWSASREINMGNWTINYSDGGMISMSEPTFTCLIGNREIQVDTLEEAEKWLWSNHSSGNLLG